MYIIMYIDKYISFNDRKKIAKNIIEFATIN